MSNCRELSRENLLDIEMIGWEIEDLLQELLALLDTGSEQLRGMNRLEHPDADKYRDRLEKVSDDIVQQLIAATADLTEKYHDRVFDLDVHRVWGRMDTLITDMKQRGRCDAEIERRLREVSTYLGKLEEKWPDWATCEEGQDTLAGRYAWLIDLGWNLISDFGAAEADLAAANSPEPNSIGNALRDAEARINDNQG